MPQCVDTQPTYSSNSAPLPWQMNNILIIISNFLRYTYYTIIHIIIISFSLSNLGDSLSSSQFPIYFIEPCFQGIKKGTNLQTTSTCKSVPCRQDSLARLPPTVNIFNLSPLISLAQIPPCFQKEAEYLFIPISIFLKVLNYKDNKIRNQLHWNTYNVQKK